MGGVSRRCCVYDLCCLGFCGDCVGVVGVCWICSCFLSLCWVI